MGSIVVLILKQAAQMVAMEIVASYFRKAYAWVRDRVSKYLKRHKK